MRPAAKIKEWLEPEEMLRWVQASEDVAVLRRRLAIWLTAKGRLHAQQVAGMLSVSTPSVRGWIKDYNRYGLKGLDRQGHGGRMWNYLDIAQERAFLRGLLKEAQGGALPRAREIKSALEINLRRGVSLSYVYKLLKRHGWPNLDNKERGGYAGIDTFRRYARPWERKD